MTDGSPAIEPSAQLPQGRYPASAGLIWVVAALAVLIGLTLAVLIPAALSSGDAGPATAGVQDSLDGGGRDGGSR